MSQTMLSYGSEKAGNEDKRFNTRLSVSFESLGDVPFVAGEHVMSCFHATHRHTQNVNLHSIYVYMYKYIYIKCIYIYIYIHICTHAV